MAPRRHNETHKTFDAIEKKKTMKFITIIKCIFSQKNGTHIKHIKLSSSQNDVFLRFNID